jgi:hypothetical protein
MRRLRPERLRRLHLFLKTESISAFESGRGGLSVLEHRSA